jgi:oligopeptide transport system ATP-binding protein
VTDPVPGLATPIGSSAGEPLLQVRNLSVEYQSSAGTVHAVNDVSFDVHAGETIGLVGESGCGKSATVLALLRLLPRHAGRVVGGEVWFGGRDLAALDESALRSVRGGEIAMIFQDPLTSLNPVLTIGTQIAEALEAHRGMGRRQALERAAELLALVGIPDPTTRLAAYPHEFSGGMRQRVMIAIALSCGPKLLIADEPTTALDVTVQAQILELLTRLREELQMGLLLITHDLGVVAGTVGRVNVMYAGQVVEQGPVDTIFADTRHPYTLGLLESLPRVDRPLAGRLRPIEGVPPDLSSISSGCPFRPRCRMAIDRCAVDPALESVDRDHQVACWVDVTGGSRHSRNPRRP